MKKRLIAVVLAATMVMGSLVGCGNDAASTNDDSSEQEQNSAQTEEAFDPMSKYEEPVTVTVGNWANTLDTTLENGDTYEDNGYLDYIKDTLNIEVEYEIATKNMDDYKQALNLAITSEELPDAYVVYDYNTFAELVEGGMAYDMTELYEKYAGETLKNFYAAYPYDALEIATFDGKLMALPRVSTSTNENGAFIWVRQDWIDKLGLVIDEDGDKLITRDEYAMLAREFVKNDPGNSGNPVGMALEASASNNMNNMLSLLCHSFGAYPFQWVKQDDGSFENGVTSPEMKDALAWWADAYADGLLDPEFGVTTGEQIQEMIANGQLGIVPGDNVKPSWYCTEVYEADPDVEFTPYGLDNGTGQMTWASMPSQDRFLVISRDCENPEAIFKLMNTFMELLHGEPNLEEIQVNYPEFYEEYILTNQVKTFTPMDLALNPVDVANQRADYFDAVMSGEMALDEVPAAVSIYVTSGVAVSEGNPTNLQRHYNDSLKAAIVWREWSENGKWNTVRLDQTPVTDSMALYQSDVEDYAVETIVKIITGEESVDYFDTFVEEFGSRGGDAICEELEEFFNN